MVTLKEYVERMPEDQKYIYYATGSSVSQLENCLRFPSSRIKNYEILYLTETI